MRKRKFTYPRTFLIKLEKSKNHKKALATNAI